MSRVVIKVFHAKWLICGVCWLCCSLWFIIVADYKDTYTVIICIPTCWNNYRYHILGSSSPRNVGIYQSILLTCQKREDLVYNAAESWNHESLLLFSVSSPGIYIANTKRKGLFTQGCREGWILKMAHF